MPTEPLIVLTGTTASGKDATGLWLAERLGGEIVSLDSMKVYISMDIGTDKPSAEDQARCPHHLLDLIQPSESMNLHRYVALAQAAIAEIRSRGRRPILVGGTAMYLNGLLHGVLEGAPRDEALRLALRERVQEGGLEALYRELQAKDPVAAAKIHPNDQQRIERALEVFAQTGQPISAQQAGWKGAPREHIRLFVLSLGRAALKARIDARVQEMFDRGLLDEISAILDSGGFSEQSKAAIGYREGLLALAGNLSVAEAVERTQAATRQFAKRQLTWFRSMKEAQWLERSPEDAIETTGEAILRAL